MSEDVKTNEQVGGGLAIWEDKPRAFLHNFDGDEREQFNLKLRCMSASGGGDACVGQVLKVKYWFLHQVEFENEETGEIVETFRTVLVEPDGNACSFVSQGVAKSIRAIYEEFGTKPLDPPLALKVVQKTTAKKRRLYVLEPA